MIERGKRLILTYPKYTSVQAKSPYMQREILVHRVRDLFQEPLTIRDYQRNPFVYRGRLIVEGWCSIAQGCRQFYLSSSREFYAEPMLRLAIYEPGAKRPIDILSRGYGPTKQERILLARRIGRYLDKNLHGLELGIFADELKLT